MKSLMLLAIWLTGCVDPAFRARGTQFKQKNGWLVCYDAHGHYIGAVRNLPNKWTVTGKEVGAALKERDRILWKQQLDAGLIDKDEYESLLKDGN